MVSINDSTTDTLTENVSGTDPQSDLSSFPSGRATDTPLQDIDAFQREQESLEQSALALLDDVRFDKDARLLAEQWRTLAPSFEAATYDALLSSLKEIAFLVALQVVNDNPLDPHVVEISSGPHQWTRGASLQEAKNGPYIPGSRWGINNPDTLYFAIPVEALHRYRLTGYRQGAGPVDINISVQKKDIWKSLSNLESRDLTLNEQGGYDILLLREGDSPQGASNHLFIPDEECVVIVRQTLGDWSTSTIDRLQVHLLDAEVVKSTATHDDFYRALINRLEGVIHHNVRVLQEPVFSLPVNEIPAPSGIGEKSGYLQSQRNSVGHFQLKDGQVLAIKVTSAGAGYYALAVTDVWGVSQNADEHQNSLNNHQIEAGDNGEIIYLLSPTTLPYKNWVDTSPFTQGIAMLRWQLLDTEHPERLPIVESRVLTIDEIEKTFTGQLIPLDTEEQKNRLTRRQRDYQARFLNR